MMRYLKVWMILMAVGLVFASCEKHDLYRPDGEDNLPEGEFFDFSTSQQVKMNISYDVPEGYRIVFDVYDRQPMEVKDGHVVLGAGLKPIASGITNGFGRYDLEKILPASVKDFYVYTSDLFGTTLLHGKIENSGVTIENVDLSELLPESKAVSPTASESEKWLTLGSWEKNGKPHYIDNNKKINLSSTVLSTIKKTFPENVRANSVYFKKTDLYIAKDAKVWLTVISSAGEYNNTLGYYCYTGEQKDLQKKDIKKIVAFPRAKIGDEWLKKGQCVQLKYLNPENGKLEEVFPKGTSIGWVLISNGFSKNKGKISYSNAQFYSYAPWNQEHGNKEHMILFNVTNRDRNFVAFGFEDMNNENGGDQDCNDVMFHVLANPVDAITDDIPEVPEEPDVDLVKDEIYEGTLAFEDLWPEQGDYDLNDVVVKYKSTATTVVKSSEDYDSFGKVTQVKDEFSLIWSGAHIHNAFGYQMEANRSNIKSLKVSRNGEELPSALDKDMDKVTIMLAEDVLGQIGMSTGNVENYTVEIEFTEPVAVKDFNAEKAHAPYNPFIVSAGGLNNNRVEVHLPMYAPTAKNNMKLLGTGDDKSDVNAGRYYVSQKRFPFALHIVGENSFINREEAVRIDKTYPRYKNWVEKGGREDADWYKYPDKK